MAYTPVDLIEVIYNGKTVGAVTADTRTQFFAFESRSTRVCGNNGSDGVVDVPRGRNRRRGGPTPHTAKRAMARLGER